jgi:anti-sigma28 factor (negative regulator of flagellin synthesis)
VKELPDREELVARIKEQVDAGTYHHSGEVIADAMARRALADRIR